MRNFNERHLRYWTILMDHPHLTVGVADRDYLHTQYIGMTTYWEIGVDQAMIRSAWLYDERIYDSMVKIGRGSLMSWLLAATHVAPRGGVMMDWKALVEWQNDAGHGPDMRAFLSLARKYVTLASVLLTDVHNVPIAELD